MVNNRSQAMLGKNLEDLTGQRFGRWTVLYRGTSPVDSQAKRPATYWHCRCDCGVEKDVAASSLKHGISQSCGCLKINRLSKNRDLRNVRFGRWLVIDKAEDKIVAKRKFKAWLCVCDCGTVRVVTEQSLIKGSSVSCGCYRKERAKASVKYEDLTGCKFGNWTVVKRAPDRFYPGGGRAQMWECLCVCGTVHIVAGNMLKAGISQSCGCLQVKSIVEEHVRSYLDEFGIKYIPNKSYFDLKGPRGGNLSYDFLILDNDACPVCFIECQGEQHYKPVAFFGGEEKFRSQLERDQLKKAYAIAHTIPLYEIPYTIRSKDVVYSYLDLLFEKHPIVFTQN